MKVLAVSQQTQLSCQYTTARISSQIQLYFPLTAERFTDNSQISFPLTQERYAEQSSIYYRIALLTSSHQAKINFSLVENSYFPSMCPNNTNTPAVPTQTELSTPLTAKVYVQCPQLNTNYEIPAEDVISVKVNWQLNSPIKWSLTLKNFDRKYSTQDPTDDYYDLFRIGEYSPYRGTKKYIKIVFSSKCNGIQKQISFPHLIIKNRNNDLIFSCSGIDEISDKLLKSLELPAFVPEEILARIDNRHYLSSDLYLNFYEAGYTVVRVNYQTVTTGFSYNPDTRILTFNKALTDKDIATMKNPLSARFIVREILNAAQVNLAQFEFKDFYLEETFNVQKATAVNRIEELLSIAVGEWLIMPAGEELTFTARNASWKTRDYASILVLDQAIREDDSVMDLDTELINTIHISRPSTIKTISIPIRQENYQTVSTNNQYATNQTTNSNNVITANEVYSAPGRYTIRFTTKIRKNTFFISQVGAYALSLDPYSISTGSYDDGTSISGVDFTIKEERPSLSPMPQFPSIRINTGGVPYRNESSSNSNSSNYDSSITDPITESWEQREIIAAEGFNFEFYDEFYRDWLGYGEIKGDPVESPYIPSRAFAEEMAKYLIFCKARQNQTATVKIPPNLAVQLGNTVHIHLSKRFIDGNKIVQGIEYYITENNQHTALTFNNTDENPEGEL